MLRIRNILGFQATARAKRQQCKTDLPGMLKAVSQIGYKGVAKATVIMQLDTSNCIEGGADPVAVLHKYPGRARSIHLKASGGGPDAVIGEDKVNWKEVFAFCESKGGTQWFVLEHESAKDPLDAVKRSFAALKKLGKV